MTVECGDIAVEEVIDKTTKNTIVRISVTTVDKLPAISVANGFTPRPALKLDKIMTETTLITNPMVPRRFKEKRIVCRYIDSKKDHPRVRKTNPNGTWASGTCIAVLITVNNK